MSNFRTYAPKVIHSISKLLIIRMVAASLLTVRVEATGSAVDSGGVKMSVFDERSTWYTPVDAAIDSTKYNHDSSLICHKGEWILAWNGNVNSKEGVDGQKNYIVRGNTWDGLRGIQHIAEFQSPEWSTNPVDVDEIEWHPSLMELNGRLECWWFATANRSFKKSLGYKSVWDDSARKWTNYKIQLLPNHRVGFSRSVKITEENDRVVFNDLSYVPLPLATAVQGAHGTMAMPMILSTSPINGILGGSNEVSIFQSTDHGDTWIWNSIVGKEPGNDRGSVWEPWMTRDGRTYHLFYRNFGTILAGKGYSYSETTKLNDWPPAADAPLDMMPMRGETVTDGTNWYLALCERAQIGDTFRSSQRIAMTLYRARNGVDWAPIAALFPTQTNAFYCWPYIKGDGFLYFAATVSPAIAVGRIKMPDAAQFYIYPERKNAVSMQGRPWNDGKEITFIGSESVRVKAEFRDGLGFSIAGFIRTGPALQGLSLDFLREDVKKWGYGFLPNFDGGWRPSFAGWNTQIKTDGITARTGEKAFIGMSFDEEDKVLRIVRRSETDNWQTKIWNVLTVRLKAIPTEGTETIIDGVRYRWVKSAPVGSDILISNNITEDLERLRASIINFDSVAHAPSVNRMYSTDENRVQTQLMLFFERPIRATVLDGKCLSDSGNTFDVPKDHFTLNGNNRTLDPSSPISAVGMELWKFGVWNRRLTVDDFRALYNEVATEHGFSRENTDSDIAWKTADVLIDPANLNVNIEGIDQHGHVGVVRDGTIVIYGDASVSLEVPGKGDWSLDGEFMFDEFAIGLDRTLISVGNKKNLGQLSISHDIDSKYRLKRAGNVLCELNPKQWTRMTIRYDAGNVSMMFPAKSIVRDSVRPLVELGRWVADLPDPITSSRSVKEKTMWRNLTIGK